jgi:molecular chaperone DnaK
MIERNTTIPTSKSQVFSTAADNQTSVEVHVTQGERPMAADNKDLGRFILDGIPPAPRGVPQVEVSFDIDANGIVNVKATDKATGKVQHITITGSSNINEAEIERMKKEAEKFAEEDKKKQETIEVRNKAESLVFQSEKTLKEAGDKVSDDIKKPVSEKVDAMKKLLENKDSSNTDLQAAYDALSTEIQKVGAEMYKAAGAGAPNAQGGTPGADMGGEQGATGAGSAGAQPDDDGVKVTEKKAGEDDAVEGEVVK